MDWQMVVGASTAEAIGAFCQATGGLGLNLVSVPLLPLCRSTRWIDICSSLRRRDA